MGIGETLDSKQQGTRWCFLTAEIQARRTNRFYRTEIADNPAETQNYVMIFLNHYLGETIGLIGFVECAKGKHFADDSLP